MEPSRELIDELRREEIRFVRSVPPVQRMIAAGELFDEACELMRIGIRNQFPDANEERVEHILFERVEIARRLESQG